LAEVRESPERALEEALSRALRDNLAPLQRTANELEQAFADFLAACSSAKPSNALPAMLRAQAFAASLSASLSVLSNFAAIALNTSGRAGVTVDEQPVAQPTPQVSTVMAEPPPAAARPTQELHVETHAPAHPPAPAPPPVQTHEMELELAPEPIASSVEREAPVHAAPAPEPVAVHEPAFDLSSFPAEIQDLHRRANRVAKVAMQDIKLLRPNDVQLGREHKDICERLRSDLDKARKEYDRRFRAIQDHPVDYFHRWMVEILAQGNAEALGEYPYPSPVLRH
jgi:hypothetical protein